MSEYFLLALVTAAVTYLLVPPVRAFALFIGAAPEVRERDVHKVPTPRLGGLAMFGGMVAGVVTAIQLTHVGDAFASGQSGRTAFALLAAGGLIVLTGFLDDWMGLDALVKLVGQIGAGGLLVYFGMYLQWLPLPQFLGGSTSPDSMLRTVLTIMIVVVVINAVNFVDGLDGLAAGIVGIAAMATFAYSIALTQTSSGSRINTTAAIAAILIGMCAGFLPHNFHPAKIFMGDTGSMLIGLLLATSLITIMSSVEPSAIKINKFPVILPLILPIAVMILPLADLVMAVVRRTSAGLSPFAPDRGHLHHRLLDVGHSHRRSVLIMYAWTFIFAFTIVGLSIGGVPLILFPLTIMLAVAVLVIMGLPRWRRRREALHKTGVHSGGHHLPPGTAAQVPAGANGMAQMIPGQGVAGHGMAGHGMAGQGTVGQGTAGQGVVGQAAPMPASPVPLSAPTPASSSPALPDLPSPSLPPDRRADATM